jgi:O-antigen/teichoic acid export membrane protein
MLIKSSLFGLVAFGVWRSGDLAYRHCQSGEMCPLIGVVPACYIALVGYLLIGIALALRNKLRQQVIQWTFWSGLAIAGGLAFFGSALELIHGHVCPRAFGWLPMCYVSLALSVLIGGLFVASRRERRTLFSPER